MNLIKDTITSRTELEVVQLSLLPTFIPDLRSSERRGITFCYHNINKMYNFDCGVRYWELTIHFSILIEVMVLCRGCTGFEIINLLSKHIRFSGWNIHRLQDWHRTRKCSILKYSPFFIVQNQRRKRQRSCNITDNYLKC